MIRKSVTDATQSVLRVIRKGHLICTFTSEKIRSPSNGLKCVLKMMLNNKKRNPKDGETIKRNQLQIAQQTIMRTKKIILIAALGGLSVLSPAAYGQENNEISKVEIARNDSLETAFQKEKQVQKTNDENTIADFRSDKKETKAKAKEARRVNKEAKIAARESRAAWKSERRAQKSRRQADKQAEKASSARIRSDKN